MTKKSRNAALIISGIIITGTIAFIVYNRKKKGAEVELILSKIGDAKTENKGDINIVENLFKKDLSKLPLPQGAKTISNTDAANIANELRKAIEGAGTDETKFYTALNKIKSVLDWQKVNFAYTYLTKRSLYKDMYEESALRKGSWGIITANEDESVIFVDKLANFLKGLPQYNFK